MQMIWLVLIAETELGSVLSCITCDRYFRLRSLNRVTDFCFSACVKRSKGKVAVRKEETIQVTSGIT